MSNTTMAIIEGHNIKEDTSLLLGGVFMGASVSRALFASRTDVIRGRSGPYDCKLPNEREAAMSQLEKKTAAVGTNEAVGVDLGYEVVGQHIDMVPI